MSNLVTNGDFELCALTGWDQDPQDNEFWCDNSSNGDYYGPHSGSCYFYFGSSVGYMQGFLSQQIATTPGAEYTLTFWFRNQPYGSLDNRFVVKWNGVPLLDQTNVDFNPLGYKQVSLQLTGTGLDTLAFGGYNTQTYFDIDDVSLTLNVPPSGPTLSATPLDSRVNLAWSDVVANSYLIERALVGGAFQQIGTVSSPALTYTDTTVSNGTTYRYRVRAANAFGNGPYSNIVTATPQEDVSCVQEITIHVKPQALDGLFWTLPCTGPHNPTSCPCAGAVLSSAPLDGEVGKSYDITLRVRGVVEYKAYTGGTVQPGTGGQCVLNGTPSGTAWNSYKLQVLGNSYYFNNGTDSDTVVHAIDYEFTIPSVPTGTICYLSAYSGGDEFEIKNSGTVITPGPGDPPLNPAIADHQPYDGQWVQINLVGKTEA